MVPGVYKAEWGPAQHAVGGGVLVFMHNRIAGADFTSCTFDGEYATDADSKIVVRWLKVKVPAGVQMAQGIPAQQVPWTLDIPSFSLNMGSDQVLNIYVPTKPLSLNVRLTRLRALEP
jgi:hypothetical protein